MPRTWRIVATTPPSGDGWPPLKEYFLVAIDDPGEALRTLRLRRDLSEKVGLVIDGEASPEYTEWLDVQRGQILSVVAVS
jgi:hypothetical protein